MSQSSDDLYISLWKNANIAVFTNIANDFTPTIVFLKRNTLLHFHSNFLCSVQSISQWDP